MGKAGRFICILTPMLCTLASLLCTLLVLVGGTNKGSAPISSLYFFKMDTRNITTPETLNLLPGTKLDEKLLKTGFNSSSSKELGLKDFYTSSLWNYCSGDVSGDKWTINACEKPTLSYAFNPIAILNSTSAEAGNINFPDSVKKANKAIAAASKAMIASYVLGFVGTMLTFGIGWFGLLSRWGSCVTTILADVSFFFLFIASIICTVTYTTLRLAFNKALKDFGVAASINTNMLSITWLAAAFSLASAVFWMFSACCCSGRSAKVMGTDYKGKGPLVERTPYTYERVASPYLGGTGNTNTKTPMSETSKKQAAGFEPYRHA